MTDPRDPNRPQPDAVIAADGLSDTCPRTDEAGEGER